MRRRFAVASGLAAAILTTGGCIGKKMPGPQEAALTPPSTATAVPTVAPHTPLPVDATPLPTRPVKNPQTEKLRKAGKAVGPVITFLGVVRADGTQVTPVAIDAHGVPTYENLVGSGFMIVVEGKPGVGNMEIGRRLVGAKPGDPKARPDLELQTTHNLGDGSRVVCDRRKPEIGGVPGINPPSFKETQAIADALNDMACRFETFIEPQSSCVVNKQGEFAFIAPDSATQFCMTVAKAWNFPAGETLVSARLRDIEGNPGPVARFRLRRPERPPVPTRVPVSPTPTPQRRRP